MKINKLLQPLIILSALHCAVATYAIEYTINIDFGRKHNVNRIYKISTFCMRTVPDVIGLDNGKASFTVDTNAYVFDVCGYEHSSADFQAVDDQGRAWLGFEFYKDLDHGEPELYITGPYSDCYIDGLSLACPDL